jgi:hypothetical protein
LQHEIDHLDGVLALDKALIPPVSRLEFVILKKFCGKVLLMFSETNFVFETGSEQSEIS